MMLIGAGGAFSGGFSVGWLDGLSLKEAGRFANAVGALVVTKLGPMEGLPIRQEMLDLIKGDRIN